jgi:NADPH:quinone reductase-like Zn-dependent oxidoreductase
MFMDAFYRTPKHRKAKYDCFSSLSSKAAAQLEPGQHVLIHAASGGVGDFAVQLAKWKGAHVIATASKKNERMLHELGVDQAIDHTTQRFEAVARNVNIVLDPIAGETQERSWKVLKRGGILVSLHQEAHEKAKALGLRAAFVRYQPNGSQLAEIAAVIDSGNLKPVVNRILPLSEGHRAHELSQNGHTHGKVVLRVKDRTS